MRSLCPGWPLCAERLAIRLSSKAKHSRFDELFEPGGDGALETRMEAIDHEPGEMLRRSQVPKLHELALQATDHGGLLAQDAARCIALRDGFGKLHLRRRQLLLERCDLSARLLTVCPARGQFRFEIDDACLLSFGIRKAGVQLCLELASQRRQLRVAAMDFIAGCLQFRGMTLGLCGSCG